MSLLERRRALISQNKEKYVFVEYIESTGTQWIDTGILANGSTKLDLDFQITELSTSFLVGSRTSASKDAYYIVINSLKTLVSTYGVGKDGGSYSLLNQADLLRHTTSKNGSAIYLDGKWLADYGKQSFTTPGTLVLFAVNNNGVKGHSPSKMKLYSCQIYDGYTESTRTLLRDFVPCYRKSDKVGGLYDTVSGEFFENQGTGEFIVGSHLLPKEYQAVEYIESSGTQFITTDLYLKSEYDVDYEFYISSLPTNTTSNTSFWSTYNTTKDANWHFSSNWGNSYVGQTMLFGWKYYASTYTAATHIQEAKANTKTRIYTKGDKWYSTIGVFAKNGSNKMTAGKTSPVPLKLYGDYSTKNNGIFNMCNLRFYYFKVTENGTVVANLVPCCRKADQKVGMYDTENDKFYTNNGTGEFLIGGEI